MIANEMNHMKKKDNTNLYTTGPNCQSVIRIVDV